MRFVLCGLLLMVLSACTNQGAATPEATQASAPAVQVNFVGAETLTGETRSVLAELVERIHPAVVQVVAGSGGGSGFIVNPSGLLVTNSHVVDGFDSVEVILPDGSRYAGDVLARDDGRDLATVMHTKRRPVRRAGRGRCGGHASGRRGVGARLSLGRPGAWHISDGNTGNHIGGAERRWHRPVPDGRGSQPGQQRRPAGQHGRRGDWGQHLEGVADRERPARVGRRARRLGVGVDRVAGRTGRRPNPGRAYTARPHRSPDLDARPDVDRSSHLDACAHVGGSPNTDTAADMDTRADVDTSANTYTRANTNAHDHTDS